MAYFLAAGLAVAAAGAALSMTVNHQHRVDHHSGPVDVNYRGDVVVKHKQVGTVAPGGRASTLRCDWTASRAVERHAVAASGTRLVRSIDSEQAISGTRPGWCVTNRHAIRTEIASRAVDMRTHLQVLAEQDAETLRAELDRIHGAQRTG